MTNRQKFLEGTDPVECLSYERLNDRYIKVVLVNIILTYAAAMFVPAAAFLMDDFNYVWQLFAVSEAVLAAACVINLCLSRKAYRFKGFALREGDVTYRSGIFFPTTTTIPFRKIQQVSIKQNPVLRLFGLYAVEITNGAQMESSVTIPGLTKDVAERMKQLITSRIQDGE